LPRRRLLNLAVVNEKINLAAKLALLDEPYEPGIVGFVNDFKLLVVKVKGSFVWHKHDETDDFFLVLSGRLTIHLRDRDVELEPGEIFVVPRGIEHCPDAEEETQVLLIEPRGHRQYGRRRRGDDGRAPPPIASRAGRERRTGHQPARPRKLRSMCLAFQHRCAPVRCARGSFSTCRPPRAP
jgi:mannose-6-phosphate isomerase-like protein (cupin superfamily)